MAWPNTLLVDVKLVFPSALYNASLLASILNTLSSQKAIRSVSLTCNFCILPYSGFISLVIFSARINWLRLLVPPVELNNPDHIIVLDLCSCLYLSFKTVETIGPLSNVIAL